MRFLHRVRRGGKLRIAPTVMIKRFSLIIALTLLVAGAGGARAADDDQPDTAESKVDRAARQTGDWVERAGKNTGAALDRAAKKSGAAVDRAAKKTGTAVEKAAHKTESALQKAWRKTGEAFQRFGRKMQSWFGGKET